MRELAAWTALTMETPNPVPFGAEIFDTERGESLMRAANAVRAANDPSAHAEVHTIRLACRKLNAHSLTGYTLYTTCEPCAMCMACALWAGLDRVVFGATIYGRGAFRSSNPSSRGRDRNAFRHEMRRQRTRRAGCVSRTLHESNHAEGFQDVEFPKAVTGTASLASRRPHFSFFYLRILRLLFASDRL